MNDQAATTGRSEDFPGRRPLERSERHGRIAWADVDRVLEVRARLVLALDFIEDGNPRMAELALFGLLDDLDSAEELLSSAKCAA